MNLRLAEGRRPRSAPNAQHAIRFAPAPASSACSRCRAGYLLETDEGQTLDTYSISAGLDYASVGLLSTHGLADIGRVNYSWATDEEAMNAFRDLEPDRGHHPRHRKLARRGRRVQSRRRRSSEGQGL